MEVTVQTCTGLLTVYGVWADVNAVLLPLQHKRELSKVTFYSPSMPMPRWLISGWNENLLRYQRVCKINIKAQQLVRCSFANKVHFLACRLQVMCVASRGQLEHYRSLREWVWWWQSNWLAITPLCRHGAVEWLHSSKIVTRIAYVCSCSRALVYMCTWTPVLVLPIAV